MEELERFVPTLDGRIAYEHLHRYAMAAPIVSGMRVLDVACGEGYGTAALAREAAHVTGVDIDHGSVVQARARYGGETIDFIEADAAALPFEKEIFDAVISFETIEHLSDQPAALAEWKRVLKPGGWLIVSSPNVRVYNALRTTPNQFHLGEMDREELLALLRASFRNVELLGQRLATVSMVSAETDDRRLSNGARYEAFTGSTARRGSEPLARCGVSQIAQPEYYIAVCTDATDRLAPIVDSVFFDAADDLWLKDVDVMRWASGIHEEREALQRRFDRVVEAERDCAAEIVQERERACAAESRLVDQRRERDEAMTLLDKALDHQQQSLRLASDLTERLAQAEGAIETGIGRRLREHLAVLEPWVRDVGTPPAAPLDLPDLVGRLADAQAQRRRSGERIATLSADISDLAAKHEEALAALARERDRARSSETALEIAASALAASETVAAGQTDAMRVLETRLADEAGQREASDRSALQLRAEMTGMAFRQTELAESERASRARFDRLLGIALGGVASRMPGVAGQGNAERQIERAADRIDRLDRDRNRRDRRLAASIDREHELTGQLEAMRLRDEVSGLFAAATHRVVEVLASSVLVPHPVGAGLEALFHPGFYAAHPERADAEDDALVHFRTEGFDRGMAPHPLVDLGWMRMQGREPLSDFDQYFSDPAFFDLSPHPLFDAHLYLAENPDVAAAGLHPLLHYLAYGWSENRRPNVLFNNYWYLAAHEDVLKAGLSPLQHYVEHGRHEQRTPHPLFDPAFYLARHPDVAAARIDPLEHYLLHGLREGRVPSARLRSLAGAPSLLRIAMRTDCGARRSIERLGEDDEPGWAEPLRLPQALRDYLIEQCGDDRIDQFVELFHIVGLYEQDRAGFLALPVVRALIEQLREDALVEGENPSPTVSIVIPAYNNLGYTLTCIASILLSRPETTFEIIVADDCSMDETPDIFATIGCIRCLRQVHNLGFIGNCNAAAASARGRYLVLLNNDTIVLTGWLDRLVEGFEASGNVGLVGSKLINGDGTLQEAGGIFWSDGSAWNYGRNQNPRLPQFNYLKDVDYCSGASIALPMTLWCELGGFDENFSPAYCEDSDLAFRVRAAGYRTVYQPRSQVVHHEGRTHGRDVMSGVKAYQIVNQQKLYARWHEVLQRENYLNATNLPLARDRSGARPRLLFVDHYVPQWDRDAGSRTILAYIRLFLDCGFHVTFWPDNHHRDPEYSHELEALGVEIIYGNYYPNFSSWLVEYGIYTHYILLSRPHIAIKYLDDLDKYPSIRKLYYGHDLHSVRVRTQMAAGGDASELKSEARKWEVLERTICGECDMVLYPSRMEAAHVATWCKPEAIVRDIPMLIYSAAELLYAEASAAEADLRDPFRLMFIGGFAHGPNADGVIWFASEVMPLLLAHNSRFHLTIAGSNMPDAVRSLASSAITPVGRLTDAELSALYARSGMSVVPLRYGGGVKGKVIEAMAAGIPVAMTNIGAQGIEDAPSLACVGDTPDILAAAIVASSEDRTATRERCLAAAAFLARHYSAAAAIAQLASGIPELVLGDTETTV